MWDLFPHNYCGMWLLLRYRIHVRMFCRPVLGALCAVFFSCNYGYLCRYQLFWAAPILIGVYIAMEAYQKFPLLCLQIAAKLAFMCNSPLAYKYQRAKQRQVFALW